MNAHALAPASTHPLPTAARPEAAVAPFQAHAREREFGFGYGNSSGYGTHRRYTTTWGQARFRCA